jgi:hypothetical protein
VKAARKDNPKAGVKKGESYYWWSMRSGRTSIKRFSKKRPRRSQLTNSEFLGAMYDAEDDLNDSLNPRDGEDIDAEELAIMFNRAADAVREAGDDCQSKLDNMESAFPNGCPTMELLEARVEACQSIADELEQAASDIEDSDDPLGEACSLAEGISWEFD